jgi:hypothetical protein
LKILFDKQLYSLRHYHYVLHQNEYEFVSKTKPLGEKAKQIRPGDIRGSRDFLQDIFKNQAQYGIKMTEDELKKALKDPSSSIREFTKQIEERGKAFTMLDDVNTQRLDMLEKMSGKSIFDRIKESESEWNETISQKSESKQQKIV